MREDCQHTWTPFSGDQSQGITYSYCCVHCGAMKGGTFESTQPRVPQPDPRDARIAELERELANAKMLWARSIEQVGEEQEECDRLAAEVEQVKAKLQRYHDDWYAESLKVNTARRALERIANPLGGRDPKERCRQTEAVAREALAALDASGATPPPAAGSPGKVLQERDPTALKLARAVELLQEISEDWTESGERDWSCSEGETDCEVRDPRDDNVDIRCEFHALTKRVRVFLAESPTAGEQEHAVLLRVAEAAERMIRRGFSCGKCDQEIPGASCVCADPEDIQMPSIRSALADLRQARERKERGDGQG